MMKPQGFEERIHKAKRQPQGYAITANTTSTVTEEAGHARHFEIDTDDRGQ